MTPQQQVEEKYKEIVNQVSQFSDEDPDVLISQTDFRKAIYHAMSFAIDTVLPEEKPVRNQGRIETKDDEVYEIVRITHNACIAEIKENKKSMNL